MVLNADVAGIWPRSPIWIDGSRRLRRDGLSLHEIRDFRPIQVYDRARPIDCYFHRVPFADRPNRARHGFCERVEHART